MQILLSRTQAGPGRTVKQRARRNFTKPHKKIKSHICRSVPNADKGPREITLIPTSALDLDQACNIISGKCDFEVFQIFGNIFTHVLCLGFSFFTSVWISIAIKHTASSYVWLVCNLGSGRGTTTHFLKEFLVSLSPTHFSFVRRVFV